LQRTVFCRIRRCAISAFGELQKLGHLGDQCLRLIMKLMTEELRRFPALTPGGGLRPDDATDKASDFFVKKGETVTTNLLVLATDDESVGRLLRTSIRHWLIDQARTTGIGSVRHSVEKVLADDDAFEQVGPGARWRLAGTFGGPFSGDENELLRAARSVRSVRIPQWSSSSRRAPLADRASIVAVCRAVLSAANGSLEVGQLVHVLLERFPVVLDRVIVPVSDFEDDCADAELTPEEQVMAAEDELTAAVTAAQVVGMLAPEERRIVRYLDDAKAVQRELGCGRSQAYEHVKRLREKLRELVGDDDVAAVGREVIRLCGGAVPA
jgi:hypothetical protein